MNKLDDLLARIGLVPDLPALPPLDLRTEPMTVELHGSTPESRALATAALDELAHEVDAKPRPRPPRPFPVSESDALARRAEPAPRPAPWFGRWKRRG